MGSIQNYPELIQISNGLKKTTDKKIKSIGLFQSVGKKNKF